MKRKIWYSIISIFVIAIVLASCIVCKSEMQIAVEKQKENVKQFVAKTINYLAEVGDSTETEEREVIVQQDISAEDETSSVSATLYDDGTLVIDGTGYTKDFKEGIYWIGDYNIISKVTKLEVKSGVKNLGEFVCYNFLNLVSIEIEEGLESIDKGAFAYCKKLGPNIDWLPESLKIIEQRGFDNCDLLEEIVIPKNVESIGEYTEMDGVIREGIFSNCPKLKKITVVDDNVNFTSDNGILFNKDKTTLLRYPPALEGNSYEVLSSKIFGSGFEGCTNLSEITLTGAITRIGESTFKNCTGLETINLNEGLLKIADVYAFENCIKLTSITIPKLVNQIHSGAFIGCTGLKEILVAEGSFYYESIDGILYTTLGSDNKRSLVKYPAAKTVGKTDYEERKDVASIDGYAFYDCTQFTKITLPTDIMYVGIAAFGNCTNLIEIVNLPVSKLYQETEKIGIAESVFSGCTGLKNIKFIEIDEYKNPESGIKFPKSVSKIGKRAFEGCASLEKVEFEEGIAITEILESTFKDCSSLSSITIPNTVTIIDETAFQRCSSLNNITLSTTLVNINSYAFDGCSSLNPITIPDTVETIGEKAFRNCITLTEIVIPKKITVIENSVFFGCTSLTKVLLPNGLTKIGNSAFQSCTLLTTIQTYDETKDGNLEDNIIEGINVSENITKIGTGAFSYCESLPSFKIPSNTNLAVLSDYIFRDCYALIEITIPENIKIIGNYAFYKCKNLNNVIIKGSSLEEIGDYSFGCEINNESNLTSINLPNSIEKIGSYAFNRCVNLKDIGDYGIPDKIIKIENGTFYRCHNLTAEDLVIPEGVISIGKHAFYNCHQIENMQIPFKVEFIGEYAFKGCENLTKITIPNNVVDIGIGILDGCNKVLDYCRSGSKAEEYLNTNYSTLTRIDDASPKITNISMRQSGENLNVTVAANDVGSLKDAEQKADLYRTAYSFDGGVTWQEEGTVELNGVTDLNIQVRDAVGNIKEVVVWDLSENGDGTIMAVLDIDTGHMEISGNGKIKDSETESPFKSYKDNIKTATISDGITKIGNNTFKECSSVTNIDIPVSIEEIGISAFEGCSSLKKIYIPEKVTIIENNTFKGCSNLIDVEIPFSIEEIKENAFAECSGLEKITIPNNVTTLENDIFMDSANVKVYCKTGSAVKTYAIDNSITYIIDDTESMIKVNETTFEIEEIYDLGDTKVKDNSDVAGLYRTPYSLDGGNTWTNTIDDGLSLEGKELRVRDRLNNIAIYDDIKPVITSITGDTIACTETTLTVNASDEYHNDEELEYSYDNGNNWIPKENTVTINGTGTKEVVIKVKDAAGNESEAEIIEVTIGHDWTDWTVTTPAECETKGEEKRTCNRCSYTIYEEIPALGHDKVQHEAKAPTCTEIGWDAYEKCSRCDYTTYVEKPALGHDKVQHEAQTETCTEIGWDAYETCTRCDYTTYVEKPALGHTEVIDAAVEPDCINTGLTEGKHCSVCNIVLVSQQKILALGHSIEVEKGVPATCIESGLTDKKYCSVCELVIEEQKEIPAKGHTEVIDAKVEATCTTAGKTEGKHCSVCNEVLVKQEEIPAKGHTEVIDAKVEATCTEAGKTEGKHCSVCNEILVKQEVIPAKGHTEVIDEKVEATCTEAGKTEGKHCSVCNEVLVEQQVILATGHKEVIDAKVEATCTTAGKTEGKHCSVCNEVLVKQEEIPATGHTEVVDAKVEPNCTEKGKTEGKHCSVCNEVLVKQEEIPAKGHTEVIDEKVEATCTTAGKTEGKHCSVCNEVLIAQKTIAPLGHSMSEWVVLKEATCTDNGTKERYCNVCGENEISVIAAKGHIYGTWTTTRETTTTQSGEEQRTCSECGIVQTRVKVYENPKTGDIIMISVISSVIAIIGIFVTTKILNQKKKES